MSVVIETTIGDITIDLFTKSRPKTCMNFVKLCKTKYYHFCVFHFVQKDFIAQTGDPSAIDTNDGSSGRGGHSVFSQLYGSQGRYFEAELKPKISHNKIGLVSMVDNGERMHGSQFFITLSDNLDYLDNSHTVFGVVAEGIDVVVKLNETITDTQFRPYQDIVITHTVILDDPFPDPKGLDIPPQSPEVSEQFLRSNRIGVHESIDDTEGKTAQEIDEDIKTKEARERALVLEMIGDIPDAEVKPPENVLFVCKLNPVTREDDLEVIFSRFGHIVSCEVIRDSKSGESLQYAFIEFENEADCEKAYFKMDNVLIDDRRIHVDFSQSVSKIKWDRKEKKNDRSSEQIDNKPKLEVKNRSHGESRRHRERDRSGSRDRRNRQNEKTDRDYRRRSRERPKRSHEKHRSRSRERYHRKHGRTHGSRNHSSSSDERHHRKTYKHK